MGCPVVTLPSGGLGSRWTASLYHLLGLAPPPSPSPSNSTSPRTTATITTTTTVEGPGGDGGDGDDGALACSVKTDSTSVAGDSSSSCPGEFQFGSGASGVVPAPIASDVDEYVRLATALAIGGDYASALRRELRKRVPALLFGRDDAIDAWVSLLESPI